MIEANPRASRTVPFVSKATGVPLAKVAARVMVGATLAELRAEGLLRPPGDGGHVVGEGSGAAVQPLPRRRHAARPRDALDRRGHGHRPLVRARVREEPGRGGQPAPDGRHRVPLARRPRQGGRPRRRRAASPSSASSSSRPPGTAAALEAEGIPVEAVVAKVGDGEEGEDAVELISSGKVDLVVNTPRGSGPRADGTHIRRAAVRHRVAVRHDRRRRARRGRRASPSGDAARRRCGRCRSTTATASSGSRSEPVIRDRRRRPGAPPAPSRPPSTCGCGWARSSSRTRSSPRRARSATATRSPGCARPTGSARSP